MAGKIDVLKQAIMLCGRARVTPFIHGHRGMGKSSIVRQVAREHGYGFIDFRCSQIEASDLRGLPDRVEGRTVYLPPADMPIGDMPTARMIQELVRPFADYDLKGETPDQQYESLQQLIEAGDLQLGRLLGENLKRLQPRFEQGILFLDELNRAQDDVMQAAFQLVLDREVGSYSLPPGWFIVCAGNFNEGYITNGFTDAAFLDRFCHLTFPGGDTTLEDWVNYMSDAHGEQASAVIEFASQNVKHLDGDVDGKLDFTRQPSRRSWEAVVRVLAAKQKYNFSDEVSRTVICGLVGMDIGLNFDRYDCPVKPRDVINRGVAALRAQLAKLDRNQLVGLMWGLQAACKARVNESAIAVTCLDFADFLLRSHKDKDVVVAFMRSLLTAGVDREQEKIRAAMVSNLRLAQMVGKYSKKNGADSVLLTELNNRPELQKLLSNVSWGGSGKPGED